MGSIKTDSNASNDGIIRPELIAHFGIRTTPDKFDQMVDWYCALFGASVVLRYTHAAFLRWDDEHHRMVIVSQPEHEQLQNRKTAACVYHIAFTLKSLKDLATSYEQKKAKGITPHWPVNHGISTSMYYFDPDGNEMEFQVDNFATAEETHAFMRSEEYAENPIGVDIVVEDWIARVRSDEPEADIKKRPRIGQRRGRWENSIYFKPDEEFTKAFKA